MHHLPHQLLRLVAEHLGATPVHEGDCAVGIEAVDALAGGVEQLPNVRREPQALFIRRTTLGHVAQCAHRADRAAVFAAHNVRAHFDPAIAAAPMEIAYLHAARFGRSLGQGAERVEQHRAIGRMHVGQVVRAEGRLHRMPGEPGPRLVEEGPQASRVRAKEHVLQLFDDGAILLLTLRERPLGGLAFCHVEHKYHAGWPAEKLERI